MSYTIGIGALIENEAFNDVRALEMAVATATQNFIGLNQPPHITIKRPFTVATEGDIKKVQQVVRDLCRQTTPFDVQLTGLGHFGDTTLYMVPEPCLQLDTLHAQLLVKLQAMFGETKTIFEGKDIRFHVSIATGLRSGQLRIAQETCAPAGNNPVVCTTISTLGVFIGLDDNTRWSVLSEEKLQ